MLTLWLILVTIGVCLAEPNVTQLMVWMRRPRAFETMVQNLTTGILGWCRFSPRQNARGPAAAKPALPSL